MTSTSTELLEILQKRLMNDKSNLISMNRQVLSDMLYVFGSYESGTIRLEADLAMCRNDRYLDAKRSSAELTKMHHMLRRFSCDCTNPCVTGGDEPCPSWGIKQAIGDL